MREGDKTRCEVNHIFTNSLVQPLFPKAHVRFSLADQAKRNIVYYSVADASKTSCHIQTTETDLN